MKSIEELWADRPSRIERKPARSSAVQNPNHVILGSVEEVRRRARELAQDSLTTRLHRLYQAARMASEQSSSARERREALWTVNFVTSLRRKIGSLGESPKVEKVLRQREALHAPWART